MKIKGAYILSLRNIKRMIAVLATAFNTICFSTATSEDLILANRCSNAALSLKAMEPSLAFDSSRIVVPDYQYREFKTLYLLKKPPRGEIPHVSAKPQIAGFGPEDRRLLRQIYRATVFGETPTDAKVAGDVRRRQVLYGASLYKPPTKHDKGVSSYLAAEKAIKAPQFSGESGVYSLPEKKTLARAIVREYRSRLAT